VTNPLTIVQLNVAVALAPTPLQLQNTGAFISQGGTTNAPNSLTLVPSLAALQGMLSPAKAITSLAWAGSVVTVTTTAPHGYTSGDVIPIVIAGAVPTGYNGAFTGTVTGASTLTYPLASNPGTETTPGTISLGADTELLAMGTTYFAGLQQQAPYVLELGEGTATEGVTALTAWLIANPKRVYVLLVPREWDGNAGFEALVGNYSAPNSLLYFYTTMVTGDVETGPPITTPYTGKKSVFGEVEAPGIPATEFSLASYLASVLGLSPNSTNRASPLNYPPAYGVTPYPIAGNQAELDTLIAANVNFINTGFVGGISSTIQWRGMLQDGSQQIFWYSADWFQLNVAQALSNEVINGNVPGGNPLYYTQGGINRLQNRAATVARQWVAAGLGNGQVVMTQLPAAQFNSNYNAGLYAGQVPINAEPFGVYTSENPNDYGNGVYNGLSAIATPITGFLTIGFNLLVTDLLVP
jgi:hypothetical protein